MKLKDLTYNEGAPPEVLPGMAVRYVDSFAGASPDYAVVGEVLPSCEDQIHDGGCGCCSENYRVTGWCWLGGEPVEDDT